MLSPPSWSTSAATSRLGQLVRGLARPAARQRPEYRTAWYIIAGSIPIGLVGFLTRHLITGALRNLWVVVVGLVVWSAVMALAERVGRQDRFENDLNLSDALTIGLVQCIALVPGVSRSGATISAGLFRNLDRVAATRISFFLSIPALVAAGGYEALTASADISASVGWCPTVVATAVSFAVATPPSRGCCAWWLSTASPSSSATAWSSPRRSPAPWPPTC